MTVIDFRSDTFTKPSPSMREAMYRADVGDDGYGEDPTVNRLQDMVADKLGKESALFMASGTMANLVSLLTHCGRGNEFIVGDRSHMVLHEQGGPAALASLFPRTVRNEDDGRLDIDQIRLLINVDDSDEHLALTKLICLENTWNGRVLKPAYTSEVVKLANKFGVKMHLDGARLFNAAVALNKPVSEVVHGFDSVQFCFSKGLAAPAGSILCGSRDFIRQARRNRKLVGGAMRQIGILAAACIIGMEEMVDRLAEDHSNAKLLAEGIAACPGLTVDLNSIETNMVIFQFDEKHKNQITPEHLTELLIKEGVLVLPLDHKSIRAVTHYGIERQDIERAVSAINTAMKSVKLAGAAV